MALQPQHYVVVWECLNSPNSSRWNAYSPVVSQILEKAFRSKLTQVLLGDADPTLSRYRFDHRQQCSCFLFNNVFL